MKLLLTPEPRQVTPLGQTLFETSRRVSTAFGAAGLALIVVGLAAKVPIPLCIWGVMALVAAVVVRKSGGRRLELWLHGTEMLAEARPGKAWTLTWTVDGRSYSGQASQMPLLWAGSRVRILVDLDKPSRMMPVGVEMLSSPEAEAPSPEVPPVLPPRQRRTNLLVLTEAKQRRNAAVVTAVLAL